MNASSHLVKTLLFLLAVTMISRGELVGGWSFEEHDGELAADMSGNNNPGRIAGASRTNGVSGRALSFNGEDDHVEIPYSEDFSFSEAITITAWIKPDTLDPITGAGQNVVRKEFSWAFGLGYSGRVGFWIYNQSGWKGSWTLSQTSVDTNWHHIAGVWDGHSLRVFLNGKLDENTREAGGSIRRNENDIHIGKFIESDYEAFGGKIDEVRIFDSALSQEEIEQLYLTNTADFPVPIPVKSPTYQRRPTFKWHSLPQAESYYIRIDTLGNFNSPIIVIGVGDTTFIPQVDLPLGRIFWSVSTGTSFGPSPFVSSFIVIDKSIPILNSIIPNPTTDNRPVFSWKAVSGASVYTIQIADRHDFVGEKTTATVADTSFRPLVGLAVGKWYWRVKADDGQYSLPESVIIRQRLRPELYAFNGATVQSARPTFTWKPAENTDTYRISIAGTESLTDPLFSLDVQDTLFVPPVDFKEGTYYWRVGCGQNPALVSKVDSLNVVTTAEVTEPREEYSSPYLKYRTGKRYVQLVGLGENPKGRVEFFTLDGSSVLRFKLAGSSPCRVPVPGTAGRYVLRISHSGSNKLFSIFVP